MVSAGALRPREAVVPELRIGRVLGLAWCCTVDADGVERNVAFGLTRRRAQQRCNRRHDRRTVTGLDRAVESPPRSV